MEPIFDANYHNEEIPKLMDRFELYNLLPAELRLYPLQFLTIPELLKVCSVCKEWYHTVNSLQSLWRGIFVKLKITGHNEISHDETQPKTIYKPSERVCHTAIVYGDSLLVYGGHIPSERGDHIGTVRNDLWEYSFTNHLWTPLATLVPTTEVQGVAWNDSFIIYGGFVQTSRKSQIVVWDCKKKEFSLSEMAFAQPRGRSAHSTVVYNNHLYVFGGWDGRESMNDLWKFDLVNKGWHFVMPKGVVAPRVRSHAAVVHGNSMYITGGFGVDKHCDDLFRFSFDTEEWSVVPVKGMVRPSPRSRVRAAVYDNRMFMYGGWNRKHLCKELWEFNFDTLCWKEHEVVGLPPNGLAQYSICVYKDMLVLFGGFCGTPSNELYAMKLFKNGCDEVEDMELEENVQPQQMSEQNSLNVFTSE